MSWSQDYLVPSYLDLLLQLTEKSRHDFIEYLEADLRNRLGVSVLKQEEVLLDEGYIQDVKGLRVTLSDGRVFVPKLIERFTENGNYGVDTYQYFPEEETPIVSHTGADTAESGTDETVVYEHSCDVVYMSDGPCGDPSHNW